MKDTQYYASVLEKEKKRLESALDALGPRDQTQPENWDISENHLAVASADQNELADQAEEAHIDTIVSDELEARYRLVMHALRKIEQGTFGICEISGKQIEEERLEANAASRTCKEFVGKEDSLIL